MPHRPAATIVFACLAFARPARAQDNYEIQVYGSETVAKGVTMIELHSNFTADGRRTVSADGELPTWHALHETLEITHGFTPWFECALYTFTSVQNGTWSWVGNHIRPRLWVPASRRWPVQISLSQEIGYQRSQFSADTWTWEVRPIADRQLGRWYLAFNPTLEIALKGPSAGRAPSFSPNVAATLDVTRVINLGLEYYGSYGPLGAFEPAPRREQQLWPVVNLNVSPDWEFNAGVGIGLTSATDHLLLKTIIGRRLH